MPANAETTQEVSDVLAELPWWVARGLLYLVLAFTFVAVVWASLSQVDIVIEARGHLIPEGDVRQVQATGSGIVKFIRYKEGDSVSRGQVLLQLDTAELQTGYSKLKDEVAVAEEQLRQLRASRGPVGETLDRQNRIAQLQAELASVEENIARTTISSPVDGVITRIDIRNPRAVVQAGQVLLAIAPADARLIVETQVPNKDVAFIEKGLPAKIKYDAFPFQDYGSVEGVVVDIAPDARFDERLGSFYKVSILSKQSSISARGRNLPLRAGLTATVELVTERRSVLSLVLEPLRKLKGEAGKLQ